MTERMTITLLDGTILSVGDWCLALSGSRGIGRSRWRRANITSIAQGTGVERVYVAIQGKSRLVGRYNLKPLRSPTP